MAKVDKEKIEALAREIRSITEAKKLEASIRKNVRQARKLERYAERFGCLMFFVFYYKDNPKKLQEYLPELKKLIAMIEPYGSYLRSKSLLYEVYQIYLNLRKAIEEVEASVKQASSQGQGSV